MARPKSARWWLYAGAGAVSASALLVPALGAATRAAAGAPAADAATATASPVQHLVVIFGENVSFDHYFGTYPQAANLAGEAPFTAAAGTPTVNGLSGALLTANPNQSNPQRLDPAQAATCDQDHGYTHEQQADDMGAMDQFVQQTGKGLTLAQCLTAEGNPAPATGTSPNYAVMDYYDGNTVTGLWNYAQNFAMSDNSYGTGFGPSSPGAVNVISGNTYGAVCGPTSAVFNGTPCAAPTGGGTPQATPGTPAPQGTETMYSDADPYYDVCSSTQDGNIAAKTIQMGGPNIGDLLNAKGVTWGWFQGGFASPGYVPGQPSTDNLAQVCTGTHQNVLQRQLMNGKSVKDYSPHHEPFQYYSSTANPQHLPPTTVADIGQQDQANHQYDLADFWAAADAGNLPSVSYLKAAEYQDGHAGYSDPLDEQTFLAGTINHLEKLPSWKSTAVVIAYDDSDGWYDHQLGPLVTPSQTPLDALTGTAACGTVPSTGTLATEQARCGTGPRLPLLVVSPFSRANFVDNTFTTQTSVVRFIEDNWLGSQRVGGGAQDSTAGSLDGLFDFSKPAARPLFLDPSTGEPVPPGHVDDSGQLKS